ncbi:MAG: DUF968 domain-containing protein [Candidatus Brocadiales bacterium]|nr:DUF968 domain-containing protein [Candidatus Bathyanammoxibius sp.]
MISLKPLRVRSKLHLRYVATLPCMICAVRPVQVHHLLTAQPKAMGKKAGDQCCVPLCDFHHRMLHDVSGNERQFMEDHNQGDYLDYAHKLAEESPCAKIKEAA